MTGQNKHDNILIRKKFHKGENHKCCGVISNNKQKFSVKYCCTYPQVYKRLDEKNFNIRACKNFDDDIYLESQNSFCHAA